MAAVSAAASDQTTELLQKLSLDSQTKPQDAKAMKISSNERSVTPLLGEIVDQSGAYVPNGYQPLYYGVYNGSINEWDEYSTFSNHNGVDMLSDYHTPRPTSCIGSATPGFNDRLYPNNGMYIQYGSTLNTSFNFASDGFNSRTNAQWGLIGEGKYKPTGQGSGWYSYANENLYASSELNRGPRAGHYNKNPKESGSVTIAVKGQNLASIGKEDCSSFAADTEQYNQEDFPEEYSDAKFFIIKSYSEDDIHKSIKYSVWASTPNGNKKLDVAFHESKGKAGGCPVFLFFSVNTSGQFVGLAEMVGSVDFGKTVDYWQQDKWTGCFSVKWHIVKDVPSSILRHITLENNDNKPLTNSRDTQEVKLEQGLQVLKIFKEHASKTSILADFSFYENREKIMLEKKAKQNQLPKQVSDGKVVGGVEKKRDATDGKHSESVCAGNKESSQFELPEQKPSEENAVANKVVGDGLKPVNGSLA